jgi:hypothetical protein
VYEGGEYQLVVETTMGGETILHIKERVRILKDNVSSPWITRVISYPLASIERYEQETSSAEEVG